MGNDAEPLRPLPASRFHPFSLSFSLSFSSSSHLLHPLADKLSQICMGLHIFLHPSGVWLPLRLAWLWGMEEGVWCQSITTPVLPLSHPLSHSATLCAAGKQRLSYLQPTPPGSVYALDGMSFCSLGVLFPISSEKETYLPVCQALGGCWSVLRSSMNILSFHRETYLFW